MSYTLADLLDELFESKDIRLDDWDSQVYEAKIFAFVNKKAAERLMELAEEFRLDHLTMVINDQTFDPEYAVGFYAGLMKAARVLEQD
jgi:hypothetical protein